MMKLYYPPNHSINWDRCIRCACALVVLITLVTLFPTGQSVVATPRAHPSLLALAATHPTTRVRVIVQQAAPHAALPDQIMHAGGKITHNLHLINAFAAELPAHAALKLARMRGVRWVTLDAPMHSSSDRCSTCPTVSDVLSSYVHTTGASRLWFEGPKYLRGQGITVAVVDSGIGSHPDLSDRWKPDSSRVLHEVVFNSTDETSTNDEWGHGTHIAGVIGGNGATSYGAMMGMAPRVNLVSVKVGDNHGGATTADVIAGLQWIYDNAAPYNIRVVNLSITSTLSESYHTSALNAAVELLWFKGIVVVVSSGNNGIDANGALYSPANDPFVISVGAADDRGTPQTTDDALAPFSSAGLTADGFAKPDLVAPGANIISLMVSPDAILMKDHPDHRVYGFAGGDDYYFRMSGTSMAAAVVSGAAALLLQDEPHLTPDQVKYRLVSTARPLPGSNAGYLDVYAAVKGDTTAYANEGLTISQILWSDDEPMNWTAANWTAANWTAANWTAANWTAANWTSIVWDDEKPMLLP